MYKNKTFLAIVPARGGSQRLPRKNILMLHKKPLIAWTIEAGLKSKYIDKLIVTSEDQEILDISKHFGAKTITRPRDLATENATSLNVLKHAIDSLEHYDYIVLLQPTSPLRNEKHIDAAIEVLFKKKADAVISVCEVDHTPLWSNILPPDDSLKEFISEEIQDKRSQDFKPYYRLNGAIYILKTTRFIKEQKIMPKDNIFAYKMDRNVSVDIDTSLDFLYAEFLLGNCTHCKL